MYNDVLLDHFLDPRHIGEIEAADGVGTVGDPDCGDFLRVYVRMDGDVIRDASFLCQGCPAAIACGSATLELAIGKTIREAAYVTEEAVSEYLGGLPGVKLHCSNLGVTALRYAIADYLGIRPDRGSSMIHRLHAAAMHTAEQAGLLDTALQVEIRKLPPEKAIGNTTERDYPIWKGKEGIVEARVGNGVGQAFTAVPANFDARLADVFDLDLDGTDKAAVANRGVFVASVNAMCVHLGIADKAVHCRDEGPKDCARDLIGVIRAGSPDDSRITLVGCQPRMIETLAAAYSLRVIDLDPDNIGRTISGVTIEGEEMTDEALDWCDIALVTGSTLVNGTIDRFVGLKCHTVFYGITIAGAAALLRLARFCPRAL